MVSTKEKDIGRGLCDKRFRRTHYRIMFTFGMKACPEDA